MMAALNVTAINIDFEMDSSVLRTCTFYHTYRVRIIYIIAVVKLLAIVTDYIYSVQQKKSDT